jgi:hypothetical protein
LKTSPPQKKAKDTMSSLHSPRPPSSEKETGAAKPLSWKEARLILRELLKAYMNTPVTSSKRSSSSTTLLSQQQEPESNKRTSIQLLSSWWLEWDLDVYLGAAGASTALLVISCVAFRGQAFQASADIAIYRSQLSASVLLLAGSLFSIWMIHRRRYSCSQGSDSLKRREISQFLKAVEKQQDQCIDTDDEATAAAAIYNDSISENGLNLVGTSLQGIYPVYRLANKRKDDNTLRGGSWGRIPTLLLVCGDYVALQVGDTAPADCVRLIEGINNTTSSTSSLTIAAGERITSSSFGETASSTMGKLPRGRTTLPNDSDELLALCNNMRIFVLLQSPLEGFLREPRGKLS